MTRLTGDKPENCGIPNVSSAQFANWHDTVVNVSVHKNVAK